MLYTSSACSCFVDDDQPNTDTNNAEDDRKPRSMTLNAHGLRSTYHEPALCIFQSTPNAESRMPKT